MGTSYLAYVRGTRPTGKALARQLGVTSFGIKKPDMPLDLLIRWGSRKEMPSAELILNPATAIKKSSNKLVCLDVLRRHEVPGIPVYPNWETVARHRGIVFGRSATGHGGKDIVTYDPSNRYGMGFPRKPTQDHDWFSIWKEPSLEVRIHVVGDKVVRVQGKYKDFPDLASSNPFIRNYEHGYRFRTPRQELHRKRKADAVKAVKALGLDFGAVDMLLFGSDRGHAILEVNSAPSCSPLTARCYAGEIALMVEQRSGGIIRLAPGLLAAEMDEMPEDDDDERYVIA